MLISDGRLMLARKNLQITYAELLARNGLATLVGGLFGGSPVFLALAGLGLVLVWLNRWVWPYDEGDAAASLDAGLSR